MYKRANSADGLLKFLLSEGNAQKCKMSLFIEMSKITFNRC